MTAVVLDASATGPIILNDETSDILPGLPEVLVGQGACVPVHWHLEVANAIRIARVRNRLDDVAEAKAIGFIEVLLVEVDTRTQANLFKETWRLAKAHELTIYDAAYLELAIRKRLCLATLDRRLMVAAERESVTLFGQ